MDELSIGEVARESGIRASAIRYYEQAGLVPAPRRTSGQRRYHPAILDRLALIQFAQQAGFTIGEIRALFEGFEEETPMSLRWQVLARQKLAEVGALMDRAERMRILLGQALACGCLRVEDCARAIRGCTEGERLTPTSSFTPPEVTAESCGSQVDLRAVPSAPLIVAAGQAACSALDIPANVAVVSDLVRHAAGQGADLLVLPELFLTGYELSAIVADPESYTLAPGDWRLDPLAIACAETHTAVVVGAPTRDPEREELHMSALVLGRDGRVAARYDKQHLDGPERAAGFSAGQGGCTVTLDGWRLGLAICWDSSFPEHARAAALDGCHAYLVGAMFPGSRGAHKRVTVCPARALDNAMYVVAANHIGQSGPYHGCGGSAVWDPEGVSVADADSADPGVAVVRLDPKVLARVRAEDFTLTDPSLRAPVQPRTYVTLD